MAGHCIRHLELLANDLATWEPEARRGEAKRVDQGCKLPVNVTLRDAGINTKEEQRTLMRDRDIWRLEEDICDRSDVAPT